MINEIILRSTGNCLVGNTAQKALRFPLPAIMRLDAASFHVFEFDGSGWIHRASQSTWKLASEYCTDESRVLVHREEDRTESGTLNVGLDFIAANGERVTSIQLVRDGESVATIDWQAGRIARLSRVHDVDAGQFLADAAMLRATIQPVAFQS